MRTSRIAFGWVLVAVAVAGIAWATLPGASGADDAESAIKARVAEFGKAWNTHDAKALAAFWAEDGDLINPWGRAASGRANVEKLIAEEHGEKSPMRKSTFAPRAESVRTLTDDLALLDFETTISGIIGPDGAAMPPQETHVTMVVKKVGDEWLVLAARPYVKPPALGAPPAGPHAGPHGG